LMTTGVCAASPPTCTDSSTAGTYIIVSGSYSYTAILGGYAYPASFSMTEAATMRLQ